MFSIHYTHIIHYYTLRWHEAQVTVRPLQFSGPIFLLLTGLCLQMPLDASDHPPAVCCKTLSTGICVKLKQLGEVRVCQH